MTQTNLFRGATAGTPGTEGRRATCKREGCGLPIVWRTVDGRNIPYDPDGQEHFMTCREEDAVKRRRRMGLEPGIFPVSPSRLELFRRCPAAYKRRYLDHERDERSPQMILGSLAHARQAAILRGGFIPTAKELCQQERCSFPLELSDDWRYLCSVMDRTEWDTEDSAVEEEHVVTWMDGAVTVEFVVKIDFWRVADGDAAGITDFKTSWDVLSPRALARDWQAQCYPWALWKKYPQFQALWFQLYSYRRQRTVRAEPAPDRDYFLPHELGAFEEGLRAEVHRLITETEFAPNPFCRICPPGTHPVARPAVAVDGAGEAHLVEPTTPAEALALAAYAWRAHRIASEAKSLLRPWCDTNGSVGPLGFQESRGMALRSLSPHPEDETTATPTIELVLDLLNEHEDWMPLIPKAVVLDGDWLASVLKSTKKWTALAAALAPYLEERITHRYEWGNADRLTDGVATGEENRA